MYLFVLALGCNNYWDYTIIIVNQQSTIQIIIKKNKIKSFLSDCYKNGIFFVSVIIIFMVFIYKV